jgi:putative resolvase
MKLLNLKQVAERLSVDKTTLRLWDKNGTLKAVRTQGGHRRYKEADVLALMGEKAPSNDNADVVAIYARVSSGEQKQKGDLDRQKGRLWEYCREKGYSVEHVFEEVGSGLNDNRAKLMQMMKLAEEHKINRVIIEHKDRLIRFNKNILIKYFNSHNVTVEWVSEVLPQSFEDDFAEDLKAEGLMYVPK